MFTALAKIYSTEYFCNTNVAGLGEIFVQCNFSASIISGLPQLFKEEGYY